MVNIIKTNRDIKLSTLLLIVFFTLGGSFGLILMGPMTALFLDLYGWRGAMVLLGAVGFHITAFGALLKDPRNSDYSLISREKSSYETIKETDEKRESRVVTCFQYILQSVDVKLLTEPMFLRILLITTIQRFTWIAWIIYLVPNVISKGVSNLSASFISTTAGVGTAVGHLLPAVVASVTHNYLSSQTLWSIGKPLQRITDKL